MKALLSVSPDNYIGKKIKAIHSDGNGSLNMCNEITIEFEDGDKILLGIDWRGQECYISQYEAE